MDEEEFDSSMARKNFGTADAMKAEERFVRFATLGSALWGKTNDDVRRQLLAPYPKIPSGFDLVDFLTLQQQVQTISAASNDSRFDWMPRSALCSPTILVGTERLTIWEARCEIVRRAIEYLEAR